MFDACALTPILHSIQSVSMFLKVEHWSICLMRVHKHPCFPTCREFHCFFEGGELDSLVYGRTLPPMPLSIQRVSMYMKLKEWNILLDACTLAPIPFFLYI